MTGFVVQGHIYPISYIVSCRVVSCRVVSCRVVSCRVVSCLVLSCLVLSCLVIFYVMSYYIICYVMFISTKSHSNILEYYMHFLNPMSTRVVGMLGHYFIIYYIIYTNHFTEVNRNLWRKAPAALPTITIRFSGAASLTGSLVFWGGAWPVGHFLQCRVSPAHRHLNLLQWEARERLSQWVNLLCSRIWRSFSFLFHNSNCISCICWVINCSL